MKSPLSSSEYANLWSTFEKKTMLLRIMEHALKVTNQKDITSVIQYAYQDETKFVKDIVNLLEKEGACIPEGFTQKDVNLHAERLFDQYFYLRFLRMLMKLGIALNAIHTTMVYRKDVHDFFSRTSAHSNKVFGMCTDALLQVGHGAIPPVIDLPKEPAYVNSKKYLSGFRLRKRPLNATELSILYHIVENNNFGSQLMKGFSMTVHSEDVRQYMLKGKKLSDDLYDSYSKVIRKSGIELPSLPGASYTQTNASPFSDKLIMYLVNLLSSFGLTSNALGTSYSLRPDLPVKMALSARDIYSFAKEGGKIMVKHQWMEEVPSALKKR
ncbi:DUF3231 family protein [Bacillus mangrovi]|uniref:DUF3231 family protein n=1 Tax=Metabacillus mangrovi TaxID=1491830 RepID=A0A7X2S8Q4_9BACI|nr:DUF3231 family protein [Metabacillus mangrovi]MTH55674.1 DUF3231 family protein [Metabacillus mangrovi]